MRFCRSTKRSDEEGFLAPLEMTIRQIMIPRFAYAEPHEVDGLIDRSDVAVLVFLACEA